MNLKNPYIVVVAPTALLTLTGIASVELVELVELVESTRRF